MRENYVQSWAFPAFSAFSVRAQKLNQQPALTYDMGNRDFVIKTNKENTSAAVDIVSSDYYALNVVLYSYLMVFTLPGEGVANFDPLTMPSTRAL